MHMHPVQPVLCGARARPAADGFQIDPQPVVGRLVPGESNGKTGAIAGRDHSVRHGFGQRAEDKVHDPLT